MTDALKRAHEAYCLSAGSTRYPVSLELSRWLVGHVERHGVETAADIGSGFTSWLLGRVVGEVVTFEALPWWERFTREWLARKGILDADIRRWPAGADGRYDLVVYDSGEDGETYHRERNLGLVAGMVEAGGWLVVDDFDRYGYRGEVEGYFREVGWPVRSLEAETVDGFGRYAGLVGPRP